MMPDTYPARHDLGPGKNRLAPAPGTPQDRGPLSFKPVLDVVWAYRRTLWRGSAVAAIAIAAILVAIWIQAPTDRFGTVGFRVTFEGADQGRYPNGTPFSSAEIVSTPILERVFQMNDLQRYMTFPRLKNSMFALVSNPAMELLSFEYLTKLSDPKLTPVDRARIEDEFRKKRESLRSAEFLLSYRHSERIESLPNALISKMLIDTLTEWALEARERRGALKYDIAVLSSNILQPTTLEDEDYIVA